MQLVFAFFSLLHHRHLHHLNQVLIHVFANIQIQKYVNEDKNKMDVVVLEDLVSLNLLLLQLVIKHILDLFRQGNLNKYDQLFYITFLSYLPIGDDPKM